MRGVRTEPASAHSRFQRFILPAFAFKAVVIGGGYATGREIAEFFLPAGGRGGPLAMLLAAAIWSGVAVLTFLLAHRYALRDYQSFFRQLLGPGWILFDIAYAVFVVLILAVFGAAAGAIGAATLGLPRAAGTIALMIGIAFFTALGNTGVERLFAWVSVLLYGVYAVFLVLALTRFGGAIGHAFSNAGPPAAGWATNGIAYASYNIVGAVMILPVTRHLTSPRDAVVAGALTGPLAMLPAALFFAAMVPFAPALAGEPLPSDYLLVRLGSPVFHLIFQVMIFAALLESGTGAVHAVAERTAHRWPLPPVARGLLALVLLAGCMLIAERVGLVALIASGYRALAAAMLAIYVLPLLILGPLQLARRRSQPLEAA